MPPALPGSYFLIVRTNVFDDVNESSFTNNFTATANQFTVTTATLTLGTPLDDTLSTGQENLYAVNVAAGQTLEVDLTSPASSAANELYVRYNALPSSINFDAAYTGHLVANQTATVPTTQPGTYYILVRGTSEPAKNTPIAVVAKVLPFEITNVTPCSTAALMQFRDDRPSPGVQFDPQAVVQLVRPQIAAFTPVNYQVVNATEIIATFNLTGAPHGLYDVEVINPDGSVADDPYRYLVEPAQPLALDVGMGGPTTLDPGQTAVYRVVLASQTNVDTPYVNFEFGVPELGASNDQGLSPGEKLQFATNLAGHRRTCPACRSPRSTRSWTWPAPTAGARLQSTTSPTRVLPAWTFTATAYPAPWPSR